MCNGLLAAVVAVNSKVTTWCPTIMDSLLLQGDALYRHLSTVVNASGALSVKELQNVQLVSINGKNFNMEYCVGDDDEAYCGFLYLQADNIGVPLYTIEGALDILFGARNCSSVLIVLTDYTIAVIECSNRFFVFDSHSRDDHGLMSSSGTSTLIDVGTSCAMVSNFVYQLASSLKLKKLAQFEMIGIKPRHVDTGDAQSNFYSMHVFYYPSQE